MKPSRKSRQNKMQYYARLAEEYEERTPDWHYWMQFVEHWRRVYQRSE